jgi:UDP-galactopyranose mutase
MYDYLIVGAGMFGATFAREMTDAGKRCLVIDRRPHIGGNCFTESVEGIEVHRYGPHIFHTDNKRIWEYVQRFGEFNNFINRPRVCYQGKIYSFPINLMTLSQLWGVNTPQEAEAKLRTVRVPDADTSNLEGWLLSQVGHELYEIFYKGYTTKQWGRSPALLPPSIAARIPIRLTFDDNYYTDRYQGIPIGGYTRLVASMLQGIDVKLECDYFEDPPFFRGCARTVVYTGPIDQFFGYVHGRLEYRSLRFEREILSGDFQGVATVNYTDVQTPYTRIVEHKHFAVGEKRDVTVITREYPAAAGPKVEPFYPVNDATNAAIYTMYRELADAVPTLFGGRLATYKYYDMHHVIAQALTLARKELQR